MTNKERCLHYFQFSCVSNLNDYPTDSDIWKKVLNVFSLIQKDIYSLLEL